VRPGLHEHAERRGHANRHLSATEVVDSSDLVGVVVLDVLKQPLKGQSYTANGQDSSCACAFVSFTVSSQPYSRNLQCLSTTARWSSHQPAPHVADRLGAGPALAVEAEAAPRAHGMPIGTLEVDI
jgi:hypothetical protein